MGQYYHSKSWMTVNRRKNFVVRKIKDQFHVPEISLEDNAFHITHWCCTQALWNVYSKNSRAIQRLQDTLNYEKKFILRSPGWISHLRTLLCMERYTVVCFRVGCMIKLCLSNLCSNFIEGMHSEFLESCMGCSSALQCKYWKLCK